MLLLSTGPFTVTCGDIATGYGKSLLVHETVGTVLTYLNCYTYIVFFVVFILDGLVAICF